MKYFIYPKKPGHKNMPGLSNVKRLVEFFSLNDERYNQEEYKEVERKLLFFDIDGTITTGGGTNVSARVREAICRARHNGHLAFISTGRSEAFVDKEIKEIGFDGWIFSAGGKVLYEDKLISDNALAPETVYSLINIFSNNKNVFYLLEGSHENFSGNMENIMHSESYEKNSLNSETKRLFSQLQRSGKKNAEKYDNTPIYKVSFFSFQKENFTQIVEQIKPYGKVVTFEKINPDSQIWSGEINDWNVSKGMALHQICKFLGVEKKNTIAFGDSMNDAEIIQAAEIGIAMGNASNDLKGIANQICESVKEDGIALALERLKII